MASVMGAGDMDVPVKFYKNEFVINSTIGTTSVSSELYLSTYCHVKYIGTPSAGASEEFLNDQKTGKVKVQITLRFASGVDFTDSFFMEGAHFNIYSIHIIGRREFLVIRGESRDDQSDVPGNYKTSLMPFGDFFEPIIIGGNYTHQYLVIKDYPKMGVYWDKNVEGRYPVVRYAQFYSDSEKLGDVPIIGFPLATYQDGVQTVEGISLSETVQLDIQNTYAGLCTKLKIGVRNYMRCELKLWDGSVYIPYVYEQDLVIHPLGIKWRTNSLEPIGPVDVKTSSSTEINKVRSNDHQDWKLTFKDPTIYSTMKYGFRYRRVGNTIKKGEELIINDAGTDWADYVPVIKIKDTEPTTYTVEFEAYMIHDISDVRVFTCEIENG